MLPNCKLLAHLLIVTVSQFLIYFVDCEQTSKYPRRTADQVGNPWMSPSDCGRYMPGYICNPDFYFSALQVSFIDPIIWKYGRTARCLCDWCGGEIGNGINVGLLVMADADRSNKTLTWKSYANLVRKKWKLGDCENNVMIVITGSGGGISFGELAGKILENTSLVQLKTEDFKKSKDEQFDLINDLIKEVHSYDLDSINPVELLSEIKKRNRTKPTGFEPFGDYDDDVTVPPPIGDQNAISIAGTNTWSANGYIAAEENDEFKAAEDKRISSSLAFMIVGSLTVILVSLIALFLIIWYYRTKTGNIEPNTIYTKPAAVDEKMPSDIKAIKYEPCKTDEPGLSV